MPDIATTLIALRKLTTKLVNSIRERKFAADVLEIQRLVDSVQSEVYELRERNLELA